MTTASNSNDDSQADVDAWRGYIEVFTTCTTILGRLGHYRDTVHPHPACVVIDKALRTSREPLEATSLFLEGEIVGSKVWIIDLFSTVEHEATHQLYYPIPGDDPTAPTRLLLTDGTIMDDSGRPLMWHTKTNTLFLGGAPEGSAPLKGIVKTFTVIPPIFKTPTITPITTPSSKYIAKASSGSDLVLGTTQLDFVIPDNDGNEWDDFSVWRYYDGSAYQYLEIDSSNNDRLCLSSTSNGTTWRYEGTGTSGAAYITGRSGSTDNKISANGDDLYWGPSNVSATPIICDHPPQYT